MPDQFTWLTWLEARQTLAARLADENMIFWPDNELKMYLTESLRTWNALTEMWNADFTFTADNTTSWYDLSTLSGSPRTRTVTDIDLYDILQAHLLEPPTGGVWTGTTQFDLFDLQTALHKRTQEVIQNCGCSMAYNAAIPQTPGTRRTFFQDTVLEPRRMRFLPATGFGDPITLSREDTVAFDGFQPLNLQTFAQPGSWSVITGPPLAMDVNTAPITAGVYDMVGLVSQQEFNPPGATLMQIPDDWSWLPMWGALADLLERESEATDRARAGYAMQRYLQGLEVMKASNWLVRGTINGVVADTPPLKEMDAFSPEWQTVGTWPCLVVAGMDFLGVCPTPASISGISMTVLGSAPIPVLDGEFVQVSREVFDLIVSYAQVLAAFKQGGLDFATTKTLEDDFLRAAMQQNKRLTQMGLFADVAHREGKRQDIAQPRQ